MKIAVIGNSCSGKTTLSRQLAKHYKMTQSLTHVDSIQFLSGMQLRDPKETCEVLNKIAEQDEWIIDGLGPLRTIENRLERADQIICIRIPLWQNYCWCLKRQIKGLFFRRPELPSGCFESTPRQTFRLMKTIWNVHHGLWVQLDRIFLRDIYRGKVIYVRSSQEFSAFLKHHK